MGVVDVLVQATFTTYVIPVTSVLLAVALSRRYVVRTLRGLYDWACEEQDAAYHAATLTHRQVLLEGLGNQVAALERPLKLVELGVGSGDNLGFYPAGCDVVCLDHDVRHEQYIEQEGRYDHPHLRILDFIPGGVEVIDGMADFTLDAVVMTHKLFTEIDATSAISSIHRVLQPAGRLYLVDHTLAAKWSRIYCLQVAARAIYRLLGVSCDASRDVTQLVKLFKQVDTKQVTLDVSEEGFITRCLVPPWLRHQLIVMATK